MVISEDGSHSMRILAADETLIPSGSAGIANTTLVPTSAAKFLQSQ